MGKKLGTKKTNTEIQARKEITQTLARTQAVTTVLNNAIKWGGIAFVAYCAYGCFNVLAGKTTVAEVAVRVIANIAITQTVSYAVGAGGIIYGLTQRHLKKKAVKHLHPRIEELETLLDEKRSTSGLTETGDTNPDDRR